MEKINVLSLFDGISCGQVALHGIKDGELVKIPKTNRFEAIGNGWTVDVIAHILKNITVGRKIR